MKIPVLLTTLTLLLLSASECGKKETGGQKYKGRLEVAGLCMNYTISVVEGNIDPALVVADWTDETTQKNYKNVFRLGSPCSFPKDIKAGDEFYFTIDTTKEENCAVCMAYYPTPAKKLSIKVVEK